MARPERKRFLRAQSHLALHGPRARAITCIRSAGSDRGFPDMSGLGASHWSPLSPGLTSGGSEDGSISARSARSVRSGGSADASALSQAITGTPDSAMAGSPLVISPSPASGLIDTAVLMRRARGVCGLRLMGAEEEQHPEHLPCGFLASFGALGTVIVTAASTLASAEGAQGGEAVVEGGDGGDKVLRLDADAFWWSDAELGVTAVGCQGHEGVVEAMPLLLSGVCSPDDSLIALHPNQGMKLSFHR